MAMMGETITCFFSTLLVAVLLVLSCSEQPPCDEETLHKFEPNNYKMEGPASVTTTRKQQPPCDEIYTVREGETLQTIGDKCGDPFIVEENPHIHDPDDVFPGLVIKITPFNNR